MLPARQRSIVFSRPITGNRLETGWRKNRAPYRLDPVRPWKRGVPTDGTGEASRLLGIDDDESFEQGDVTESLVGTDQTIDGRRLLNWESHRQLNCVKSVNLSRLPMPCNQDARRSEVSVQNPDGREHSDSRRPRKNGDRVGRSQASAISVAQVGRYLREAALQPHKKRYWLNTREKDPVVFQERVEAVCNTYQEAPALARNQGTHTISTDEMTGLQALERTASRPHLLREARGHRSA